MPSALQNDYLTAFPSHSITTKKHKCRDCIPSDKPKPASTEF